MRRRPRRDNAGGVPELITHGVDGFAEAVGDIEAQARRVVSLLTDDALFDRMCFAARQSAVGRFATSRIIPQYERITKRYFVSDGFRLVNYNLLDRLVVIFVRDADGDRSLGRSRSLDVNSY